MQHGAPTVLDYNLTLNRIFRLKKFRSGHPARQEFFNPPSYFDNSNPVLYNIQILIIDYNIIYIKLLAISTQFSHMKRSSHASQVLL